MPLEPGKRIPIHNHADFNSGGNLDATRIARSLGLSNGDPKIHTHNDLAGVTTDQHHSQFHHAEHEPGGGDVMAVDAAQATGSLRTISTSTPQALGTAAAGNGTSASASNHVHPLPKLDDLAAPDDNTDLDVSTSAHGLAPKLPNDAAKYLDGTGAYTTPSGSVPGVWTAYTPALTATTTNPTLGSGGGVSAAGRYVQTGKLVTAEVAITFGTSGVNAGSGEYRVSLPVTAKTNDLAVGVGYLFDSSASTFAVVAVSTLTTTTVGLPRDGAGRVTNGAPWTWAASDQIRLVLTYEAA